MVILFKWRESFVFNQIDIAHNLFIFIETYPLQNFTKKSLAI